MPGIWPHQHRSIVPPHWTQPELRGFGSDQNRLYLKQQVLKRFNGAISDANLIDVMEESVKYYMDKYIDATYGATTDSERNHVVQMLNERVLGRIGQLYASQRVADSFWLQSMHQHSTMNLPVMQNERKGMLDGYDQEMTL